MGLDLDFLVLIPDAVQPGNIGIRRDGVLAFFVCVVVRVKDTHANNAQDQSPSPDCVLHPCNLHQRWWHRATRNWVYILAPTGGICRLHQWGCQDVCCGWDFICRNRDVGLSFSEVGASADDLRVGITAGESENPRQAVPRAIQQVFWRILIFYIGTWTWAMAMQGTDMI